MYNIFGKVRCSATDKDLGMYTTSRIKVHIVFFAKMYSKTKKECEIIIINIVPKSAR